MARAIGSHVSLLLRDLIILFKDDCVDVLKGLIQNLIDTVDIFSHVISPDRPSGSSDLLAAIMQCEQRIASSNDWRLQEMMVDRLSLLTCLFSSDQIHNKLIPLIFYKLHYAVSLRLY